MSARASLWLIALAYLFFASQYNRVTPFRTPGYLFLQRDPTTGQPLKVPDVGAPDERAHTNYVASVLAGRGFPVLSVGDQEGYQSHQPPLFYLIDAAWCRLIPTGRGAETPVARIPNMIIGLSTLLGIFFAARWGLGSDAVGLAAATIAGLMPMFIALNSAVSNDPLLFAICTWTLALCARSIRDGWTPRSAFWIGLLMGLGLLTKTTALALFPAVLIALLASKLEKRLVATALWCFIPALIVAAPWWIRNAALYGDPLAMKAFGLAFANSPKTIDFVNGFGLWTYLTGWLGWWTLRSFFGVFGYMDLFLSATLYRILAACAAALAIGWVVGRKRYDANERQHAFHLTCWALLVTVTLFFLQFNATYFQAQARYLYPAIAPIAIGLAIGACALFRKAARFAWIPIGVSLSLLNWHVVRVLEEGFYERIPMTTANSVE